MEYLTDRYTAHLAAYNQHTKAHIRSLASSFSELGLCREDIQSSFDGFAAAAEVVWSEACTSLELEVQGLRERVASDLTEARKVRESLGDTDEPDVELAACEQEFESDRAPPLRQLADRVERRMAYWSRRKQDRLAEYESAMAATSAMRAALGLPQPAAVMTSGGRTDMSREKIDALRAEQTRLLSDRERRLGRLVPMLAALGARCTELGEPPSQVLADVHHTLWPYHESLGNSSDRPGTCGGDDHASASASVLTSAVDLSDGMFERLAVKAQAMAELKAERESQASAHTALLTLLWRELRIPRDEHERASLEPLLHGASRLHGTTIAKCRAAIWHLEDAHLDSMKSLVVAIAGELEDMCRESLMPPPDVAGILGEMNASPPARGPAMRPTVRRPALRLLPRLLSLPGPLLLPPLFVLSIPVARGANWFLAGGGRRMDEEEATAAAAERIAAAAEDGTSLPVRLATDVVRFLYGGTGRREPADGGVVSASLLNAKPAVGGIGVEPRGGGVLRVLFTVASDAVADTVVRWRHELRRCVDSTAVFDVLSDREEAQHQALWPAFLAAKVAGKRAQFHRARLVVDGERPDRRPGDVGDVLGAMVRMQSNLAPECGRRAELVAIVNQLEVAREEVAWLAAYEADDNRFKGRDGHSNLQRSIRAARVRERTPALVSAFNLLAAEWRRREGCAFAVWGDDYAELVLPSLTADLDASMADHKAATLGRTASIRRASGGGGMEPPSPQSHRPGGWAPLPRAPSMSASGGGLAKEHKGPQPPAPARGGPEPRRATGSRGGGSESLRESGVYGTPPTGPRTSRGAPMAPPPPRGATPTHTTPSRRVSDGGSISAAATPRKAGAATYGTPLRSSTTTPLRSSTTTPMTARPAAGGAPAYSGGKVDGTLTARARLEARPTPPQHQHQQQMRSSHSKIPTASARAEGYGGEPHVAKAVAAAAAHEYDSDVTDDAVGPRDAPRAQPASSPKPGAAVASPGAGVRAWTPRSRRGVSEGGNNGGERGDCSPPGSSDSSGKAAGGGSSAARQLAVANAGGSARWSGNFRTDTSKASTPTC
ncbi:hypothetical protein FOA52_009727 [Chlamydomonas sp. UWO 241]|nr:hypothetical protein FOA52_009727 [Chlamydomonas sp. UWO 241]